MTRLARPTDGPALPFFEAYFSNFIEGTEFAVEEAADIVMALKALSQNGITGALVRTLDFAQRYTAAIDFAALDRARFILDRTHAFADPNEADAAGIRLILPTPEILADAARH